MITLKTDLKIGSKYRVVVNSPYTRYRDEDCILSAVLPAHTRLSREEVDLYFGVPEEDLGRFSRAFSVDRMVFLRENGHYLIIPNRASLVSFVTIEEINDGLDDSWCAT